LASDLLTKPRCAQKPDAFGGCHDGERNARVCPTAATDPIIAEQHDAAIQGENVATNPDARDSISSFCLSG
jgi:hypothetical protein